MTRAANLLIVNSENSGQPAIQYLTEFNGHDCIYIAADSVNYLLVPARDWQQAQTLAIENEVKKLNLIKIDQNHTSKQALAEIIAQHKLKVVTIDSAITSYQTALKIKELGLELTVEPDVCKKMRIVKTKDEVTKIRKAEEIARRAYERLVPEVTVGVTENFLAARLEFLMREEGADNRSFDTIIASGPHSALPHAATTDRLLAATDSVIIDFGCMVDGYCSDLTRTVLMPEAPEKLHEIFVTVQRALETGMKAAKTGVSCQSVDSEVRNLISEAGYGDYFPHATGHGIGMEVHELPLLASSSSETLGPGNVVTIEPGIYIPELGGVRLEEICYL